MIVYTKVEMDGTPVNTRDGFPWINAKQGGVIRWGWVANGAYEILRTDGIHLSARVIELGRDRWRWRAWDGKEYVEGIAPSETVAKCAAMLVASPV